MKRKLFLLVASLAMLLVAAALALAQTGPESGVRGLLTSISGAVVLVEEDPTDESGSAKGAFAVTGETEILRQQGDELVPAAFEDLSYGQLVEATYAGPVAESYPPQGTAGSIVILDGPPADDDRLLCLLPEGCDVDGDGVPDFGAGQPVPGGETNTGFEQYNAA